jgi:hypothetical protein
MQMQIGCCSIAIPSYGTALDANMIRHTNHIEKVKKSSAAPFHPPFHLGTFPPFGRHLSAALLLNPDAGNAECGIRNAERGIWNSEY